MEKAKLKSLFVTPDIPIKQAMQKLNKTAEKILFIVDEHERLLGTVTDGDVRRGIINGLVFTEKIENVMCRNFTAVAVSVPNIEEQARKLMLEKKIERIPVLDDKGIIIDVILWTDILEEKKHLKNREFLSNQVVIMAGGKGTRLDPFTKILPKPLIPIENKPVIELIMENFYRYGFHTFLFTLNYKKEYIKLFLRENDFPYVIDWVEEEDFLGTAGSLSLLKDKITDTFFVTNCDSLLEIDSEKVLKWHKEQKAAITIIGCHNEVKIQFGVLEISDGKLQRITEKPVHDVLINTGVYVLEPHVLSYIPERTRLDMNELIDIVVKKEKISVYPIYRGWFDIGQWDEYKKMVEKIAGIEGV